MKPHTTLYQGCRWADLSGRQQRIVVVDGAELDPTASRRFIDHSPFFNWGFTGYGPAQLALAILYDYLDDRERALALHRQYQHDVIRHLGNAWRIQGNDVEAWLLARGEIGHADSLRRIGSCV